MNEGDGAAGVVVATAQQEVAQVQAERLPVDEPPVEGFATGVDAVTSTELD